MTVEIRAVGPACAAERVRVLPRHSGRPMWEPAPAARYGEILEQRSGGLDRFGRVLRTDPAPLNSFAC